MSPKKSAFWKIGVLFSMEKSVERGRFVFWRTIIRPPFRSEWRDRAVNTGMISWHKAGVHGISETTVSMLGRLITDNACSLDNARQC